MTQWINHVKDYQNKHNVSYKDALKMSRTSYKPKTGGDLKTTLRKAKNTSKRVAKVAKNVSKKSMSVMDYADKYVELANPELANNLRNVKTGLQGVSDIADQVQGSGARMRKVKNTIKKISRIAEPLVALADPELGLALHVANSSMGGKLGNKNNKYMNGGSFKTMGGSFKTMGGCVACPTCGSKKGGSVGYGRAQSSVLSDTHNSFKAPVPKSYREKQHTN